MVKKSQKLYHFFTESDRFGFSGGIWAGQGQPGETSPRSKPGWGSEPAKREFPGGHSVLAVSMEPWARPAGLSEAGGWGDKWIEHVLYIIVELQYMTSRG
jgi:hypothetical protein